MNTIPETCIETKMDEFLVNQDVNEYYGLHTEKIFGISNLNNKLHIKFVNDKNVIVYLSGNYLVLYDISTDESKLVPLHNKFRINSIYVFDFSMNHKIVLVEIDSLTKTKRINFINIDTEASNFIDLEYSSSSNLIDLDISYDSSRLVILLRDTEWIISVWCLQKYELVCELSLTDSMNEVVFHPIVSDRVLLIGSSIKSFKIDNHEINQEWSFTSACKFTSHTWINETHVLLGSEHGEIFLFNIAQKKIDKTFNLTSDLAKIMQNSSRQDIFGMNLHNLNVSQLIATRKGFISLIDSKRILIYSMNKFLNLNLIGFAGLKNTYHVINQENSNKNYQEDILNISLNKAEDILLVFTNRNSLFRIDLHHDGDEGCSIKALDLSIIKNFHHKKIIAVDSCIIKPYMVTCDAENTIKLWNYRSGEHELSKTFNETIISVGLNNSNGLCLAISFLNKIVFYLIVQNRLKYLKTLNLSLCVYLKFSNETNLLGAITLSSIYIYDICSYELKLELSLKSGKINHFIWVDKDRYIISCSNLGMICVWDVSTGDLVREYSEKHVSFSHISAFLNHDANKLSLFATDRLNNIHVIKASKLSLNSGENVNAVDDLKLEKLIETNKLIKSNLTCFAAFKNFLLLGCSKGRVYLYNSELDKLLITTTTTNLNHNNNNLIKHNSSLCQLFLISNLNMNYVASCSIEGLVVLSSLIKIKMPLNSSCTNFLLNKEEVEADAMLITKCEIENKTEYIVSLKQIIVELNEEKIYQIKISDIEHKEKLQILNENVDNNLTRLNILLNEINSINQSDYTEWKLRFERLIFKFKNDLECVRENAEVELCNEYKLNEALCEKYRNLCGLNEKCLDGIQGSLESANKNLNAKLKFYEDYKINDLEQEAKLRLNSLSKISKIIGNEINKAELNGDRLVQEMKLENEAKITSFKILNEELKFEISVNKNKLVRLKDKLELLKEKSKSFNEDYLFEKKRFLNKQEQIFNLNKVLKIKSIEMSKNEKLIFDSNKRKERLNKTSFILESKLNELVADISKLNKINEQLKLNMQLNEQKLGTIISSKLKLAKKYELKSSASSLRISNGRLRMKNMNLFARKQSFYSRVNSR